MRRTILELIDFFAWPIGVALIGANVQSLKGPWKGWRVFIAANLAAAFSAIVCMSILPEYVSYDFSVGISGIMAYSGGTLIDAVVERMCKEIKE